MKRNMNKCTSVRLQASTEENKKVTLETTQPQLKKALSPWFSPMQKKREFVSKSLFQSMKRNLSSIKNDNITVAPNHPTCNHNDLFEDCKVELTTASDKHIFRRQRGYYSAPLQGKLKQEMF
jgi:hypothetical protein